MGSGSMERRERSGGGGTERNRPAGRGNEKEEAAVGSFEVTPAALNPSLS